MTEILLTLQKKYANNCVGFELCRDSSKIWLNIFTSKSAVCKLDFITVVGGQSYFLYKGLKLVGITKLLEKALS
ncbi:MAG: hypothetical protein ACRDD7_12520 [Peptostreptococcaceae bacterium]